MDSSELNYNLIKNLLNGESIKIKRTVFNIEWKELTVNRENLEILVQGLPHEIKTIYNTLDVNFKFIDLFKTKNLNINIYSKPKNYNIIIYTKKTKFIYKYIKKNYSIIVHPLFPVDIISANDFDLYTSKNRKEKLSIYEIVNRIIDFIF